jgi:ectoine hydroxylase-related dioxygenase (phytanoyl-CoA dioxygenase family)
MHQYAMNRDGVQFFREHGYVIARNVLTPHELEEAHRVIAEIIDEQSRIGDQASKVEWEPARLDGQRVARRIYYPVDHHEMFSRISLDDRVLDPVESLLGPDIQLVYSKVNMKEARVGSAVEWHQDLAFTPHTNSDYVSCLIYLDAATVENGCLQVIPWRDPERLLDHTVNGRFAGRITETLPRGDLPAPVPCEAEAGSMVLMHCMTPHSSLPNTSTRPRRTLILEYRAADAYPLYYPGKEGWVNEKAARIVRGHPSPVARFSLRSFPVPVLGGEFRSIYELQQEIGAAV